MKITRGLYQIATREGRETVTGYACGDFGCTRGKYTWNFTHLPTGLGVSCGHLQWVTNRADAIRHLKDLGERGLGALPEHIAHELRHVSWGGTPIAKR